MIKLVIDKQYCFGSYNDDRERRVINIESRKINNNKKFLITYTNIRLQPNCQFKILLSAFNFKMVFTDIRLMLNKIL